MNELKTLIESALKTKWFDGSTAPVFENCVFCEYAKVLMKTFKDKNPCEICLCPKEICDFHAMSGIMNEFRLKYAHDIVVKQMDLTDLNLIRDRFEYWLLQIENQEKIEHFQEGCD
jgi:hypothetical protein